MKKEIDPLVVIPLDSYKKFKLSKASKKAWIQALESGMYKKGNSCLFRDGKYCCLGVLADQLGMLKEGCFWYKESTQEIDDIPILGSSRFLESACCRKSFLLPSNIQGILAKINDESETFEPVITYIEQNL